MDKGKAPREDRGGLLVRPSSGFRTDIQALRAVAVLAVVVNHLSASWLTGGYVGVDVFFVISGFLITAHLDREILATGRVRLGAFYARRVRRLLPAALLVLGLSVVAAYFLLPYPRWAATAEEAVASATYWENWLLSAKSVDYSAANTAASLVQHYWSLSVEEQFYLVWPLLLWVLALRRVRVAGVAVIGAASFGFSVYYTDVSPSEAYFATPVRIWEFALGALIALAGSRMVVPRVAAGFASFAGFALIAFAAVSYDHHTAFPGFLALVPTLGTALVIVGGLYPGRQWHTAVTAAGPVQLLGNISYSLYLWHWPLIVLAPFVLGDVLDAGRVTTPYLLAVLGASLVLAYLSKVLVEDLGKVVVRRTGVTFAAMVVGVAACVVAASTLNWTYERHVAQAERDVTVAPDFTVVPCRGAVAMVNDCPDRLGPADIVTMGPANSYVNTPGDCVLTEHVDQDKSDRDKKLWTCDYSGGDPAAQTVWLLGDSHAQHWQHPLFDLARERKWVLKMALAPGCPFADVEFTGIFGAESEEVTKSCGEWTRRITDLVADDRPAIVFTSFFARQERADDGSDRSQTEQYREGLESYWRAWTDAGAQVVVLVDPPLTTGRDPNCVELNPDNPVACAVDRASATPVDPLTEAARDVPGVTIVDLTSYFCDSQRCYAVVGNVVVYFDDDHMNSEFSRSLKPMIAEAVGLCSDCVAAAPR
ncbi:acyltransferase family protein [Actinophytocola sp.]|uniref:acyltransferase family protein n=1 Tax=Actinophytocola sp. TaxID=1872138 RepID=UPI002ECFD5DF